MIEIYDSATRGFRGLTVYGNTRQNLWTNPRGTADGVTVTANGDGSFTASGANNTQSTVYVSEARTFALRDGTTYTASIDKAPVGFTLAVQYYNGNGFVGTAFSFSPASATEMTFTVDYGEATQVRIFVQVTPGSTVSGTYRIMLNEGSEAQPWCPPGLNGVDELSVVTAGKNLANVPSSGSKNAAGITFEADGAGGISVSGTSTERAQWANFASVNLAPGAYVLSGARDGEANIFISYTGVDGRTVFVDGYNSMSGVVKFELADSAKVSFTADVRLAGKSVNTVLRPQLERGESPTSYEPPAVTTTPIDLDGHTLNGLPDGTRDELRIDGTGAVTLVQRVGAKTLPGDAASWNLDASSPALRYSTGISPNAPSVYAVGTAMSDALPPRNTADNVFSSTSIIAATTVAIATVGTGETAQDIASACGGKTLLYKLAAPQVIDLPPVEVPQFKRKKQTIIYAVANVPAEIKLDYLRWSTYADGFAVDGVHSFRDMGCCVAASDSGSPSKKLITKTVPHMSGFYDFSKVYGALAYESREVTYRFDLIGDDMQEQKSRLLNWLGTIHDADIFDDLIEGYHFRGSYSSAEWEEGEESESGSLTVTFLCHPFLIADAETVVQLKDGDNGVALEGFAVNPYASAENAATVTIGGAAQSVGTSPIRLSTQLKTGANIVNVTGAPVTLRWREQKL